IGGFELGLEALGLQREIAFERVHRPAGRRQVAHDDVRSGRELARHRIEHGQGRQHDRLLAGGPGVLRLRTRQHDGACTSRRDADGPPRRPHAAADTRSAQRAHAAASRNRTAPARMTVVTTKMHAAHRMMAPPDGTGRSSSIGTSTPAMQLTVANVMLRNRKPRSDVTTLRAAAAGISSRASTSTAPTILRQATVISVIMTTNTYSSSSTRTPRACARLGLKLATTSRL